MHSQLDNHAEYYFMKLKMSAKNGFSIISKDFKGSKTEVQIMFRQLLWLAKRFMSVMSAQMVSPTPPESFDRYVQNMSNL